MRKELFILLALLMISVTCFAQKSPRNTLQAGVIADIPICTQSGDQITPVIVSDGAGGFIVAWQDNRDGTPKIYCQRLSSNGASLWADGGVRVSFDTADQTTPRIVSDGTGGAIIELQNDVWDEYAPYFSVQRIDENGNLLWNTNGITILSIRTLRYQGHIVDFGSDGEGGAVFLARVYHMVGPGSYWSLGPGRISASGMILWNNSELIAQTKPSGVFPNYISQDGKGGAMFTWCYNDVRQQAPPELAYTHLRAARVDSMGDLVWTTDMMRDSVQEPPYENSLCSDNSGGVFVCWVRRLSEASPSLPETTVLAQWIDFSGVRRWGENGIVVCNAAGNKGSPLIALSPAGGLILAWQDFRNTSAADLYAARIYETGDLPWIQNGVPICQTDSSKSIHGILSDLEGGAAFAWDDKRNGLSDVYAQSITSAGAARWSLNGIPVVTKTGEQSNVVVSSNDVGRPFAVWQDERNATDFDIYGQWVDQSITPQVGSLTVSVQNISGYGVVGHNGRISLFDKNRELIQTQNADSLGKAYFTGIQADTGYSIQTNCVTSNPSKIYGNEFWGERRGLTISGAETTAVTFMRNTPYTSNIKVYDNNTNELVSGNVPFGTPLRVSIEITNPNEQGSVLQSVRCSLTLDRNKQAGYEFRDTSVAHSMLVGTKDTFDFAFTPADPGDYFHVAGALIKVNGNDVLTEGGQWGSIPTFRVEPQPPSTVLVTVEADPKTCSFIVDDSTYTGGRGFVWLIGSIHLIGTTTPQIPQFGTKHNWSRWSDGDSVSHHITTPDSNNTYAVSFDTSFYLTMTAGNGGSVEPASGWFKSGTNVSISATPNDGWRFSQWIGVGEGSYSGNDAAPSIRMDSVISETGAFEPATGISDLDLGVPNTFVLNGNYPNPFNPSSTIRFGVPTRTQVRISVYNILGELVARLVDTEVVAGFHEVRFDGSKFSSGMYLYRLEAGSFVQTKSLILVK